MKKYEVILGLGSNLGDRRANLRKAIIALAEYIDNIHASSVFESAALLPENAPIEWNKPFCNMAIIGETRLPPQELLIVIKQIEIKLGRNDGWHWSPRVIDVDILAMGSLISQSNNLVIPHRELLKRDFALVPLVEIAPDWVHPLVGKTAKQLLSYLPETNNQQSTTKLVGIINITPDSFSDGGVNYTSQAALESVKRLVDEGADIIDIGAESTRPEATPISPKEEWERLEPLLLLLRGLSVPISIDTRHAKTAQKALALGASWINDVSGFTNPEMVAAVRDSTCKLVVMHSLSVPSDKNIILPLDANPVELIISWANERFIELEREGISPDRIIFDVGIGFGKNTEQSHILIKEISRFKVLCVPILVGHSRKRFLGIDRSDDATLKISQFLVDNTVDYLRVHNVKRHKLELA